MLELTNVKKLNQQRLDDTTKTKKKKVNVTIKVHLSLREFVRKPNLLHQEAMSAPPRQIAPGGLCVQHALLLPYTCKNQNQLIKETCQH